MITKQIERSDCGQQFEFKIWQMASFDASLIHQLTIGHLASFKLASNSQASIEEMAFCMLVS